MDSKKKAIELIADCNDGSEISKIAAGVFLETSASMVKQQAGWDSDDPGVLVDFTAYPYWITTDNGTMPQGVTGADDTTLLDIIADNQ